MLSSENTRQSSLTVIILESLHKNMKRISHHPLHLSILFAFSAMLPSISSADVIDLSTAPDFVSLQYEGSSVTTITGIRDQNITGNYSLASDGNTGGLLFNGIPSVDTAMPYPVATANNANFPNAVSSTPYGPSFGSPNGILRAVGSFKVEGAKYDQGYLFDGVTGVATTLLPSTLTTDPILFTIAHSNFGNQVVGNFDTELKTGNSFIYNIASQTYSSVPLDNTEFDATKRITDVVSNTAYGVYNNMIAGGYAGKFNNEVGTYSYIHNQATGKTYTFSSPEGSIVTHFEGITSAGRPGIYNMVADAVDVLGRPVKSYVATVDLNRIDPATGQPVITWTEIRVGSSLTSANSMYQGNVIGVFVDGETTIAYYADIGDTIIDLASQSVAIYDPVKVASGSTSLINAAGADVLNVGSFAVSGSDALQSGSSCGFLNCGSATPFGGVITNLGSVEVSGGNGYSAVLLQGTFGTLVNNGTIKATSGDFTIKTDGSADGTLIVNSATGVIDGQISVAAGAYARFENSGLITVSSSGSSITHAVSGTFVQTSTGVLDLRVSPQSADQLAVSGTAKIAGALEVSAEQGTYVTKRHTLVSASEGLTGTFDAFSTDLQAAHKLTYDRGGVYLDVFSFTTQDVQASINQLSASLQQTLAIQNATLVNSLMYDCEFFNAQGICVSVGGRYTSANGTSADDAAATVVAAYQINKNWRVGAYIDQMVSNNSADNLVDLSTDVPLIGIFGVWQERPDGLGLALKVSAAYGQQNATLTRPTVNGTERGSGTSKLTGQGVQLLSTYGFALSPRTIASPYIGLRYTKGDTQGYSESASDVVTAPLSFGGLNNDLATVLAGVGIRHQFSDSWTIRASVGVESDLNQANDTLTIQGLNGLADLNFNANPVRTRATLSAGLSYDVTKMQRIAFNYLFRQSPYEGINTQSVFLNYSFGF